MDYLNELGKKAKEASYYMNSLSTEDKNRGLLAAAKALIDNADHLISCNKIDVDNAIKKGISEALVDRLTINKERVAAMAEGLEQVAALQDPVGVVLEEHTKENGLRIVKESVPMGVIGIIYESRPNVTPDAFGLCFKAGNAVILKGGSDAINSNIAMVKVLKKALSDAGINEDVLQLIEKTDRETAVEFMKLNSYVNLLIPRGGAGLIRSVVDNATIPVIETGTGNCHIFVDESADLEKAIPIIINAKTQRLGVCNACESLLVHEAIADKAIPAIYEALSEKDVEIRTTPSVMEKYADCIKLKEATDEDWGKEYLARIVSLATVPSVSAAIDHINRYNTHHSEAIITENTDNAELFLQGVDAACVYVNASTRFTDGFEFGLGAEIGISTQKMHARGPMGLRELTSYKYKIYGNGQVRG